MTLSAWGCSVIGDLVTGVIFHPQVTSNLDCPPRPPPALVLCSQLSEGRNLCLLCLTGILSA